MSMVVNEGGNDAICGCDNDEDGHDDDDDVVVVVIITMRIIKKSNVMALVTIRLATKST